MSRRKLREMEARAAARREAASEETLTLFADGGYDDGEAVIRAIDADIQGDIMIEACCIAAKCVATARRTSSSSR